MEHFVLHNNQNTRRFIKYEDWLFINKYYDKSWNWKEISKNPNITMTTIINNPTKPWNWYNISNNPNITMEMIEKDLEKSEDQQNPGFGVVYLRTQMSQ